MSENVDYEKLIFTDEQAISIKDYDRTIELVGISGDLDSGIPNVFKFTLRQQEGYQKIQFVAFQHEHEVAKNTIVENGLIHIQGGDAKPKQGSSLGSIAVDIHLSSISKLTMIKKVDTSKMLIHPTTINVKIYKNIADAVNTSGIIGIEGFLKFEVEKVENKFSGSLYQGCMVDYNNIWKIELRLKSMGEWVLEEVSHIKAIGQILIGSYNRPFLFVTSPTDIIKMSEKTLTTFEMSEAWDTPVPDIASKRIKVEHEKND